jgi:hypothetical protein
MHFEPHYPIQLCFDEWEASRGVSAYKGGAAMSVDCTLAVVIQAKHCTFARQVLAVVA